MTGLHQATTHYLRFDEDAPYLRLLGKRWNQKLIEAFGTLPEISWGS